MDEDIACVPMRLSICELCIRVVPYHQPVSRGQLARGRSCRHPGTGIKARKLAATCPAPVDVLFTNCRLLLVSMIEYLDPFWI